MKKFLKTVKKNTYDKAIKWYRRTFVLKNKNFTIISNNCWGGAVYQRYGLQYLTPTVGLCFFADEYLKFVSNLKYYLTLDLKFITKEKSRYYEFYSEKDKYYPIGVLGDIEICFVHYKSEKEAYEKWNRRKQRINWNNIIYKFNDQNQARPEHFKEFNSLPYKNKISFSANPVDGVDVVQFTEYAGYKCIPNDIIKYTKYFNIDKYLNGLVK